MNIEERLSLLEELLTCNGNIYCWTYDSDGHLQHSNCTELLYEVIFEVSGCKNYLLSYGRENSLPLILGEELGLIWIAAFEKTDNDTKYHVIGPLISSDISYSSINNSMYDKGLSTELLPNLKTLIHQLPVVTAPFFLMYTIMLHCCVTGEKIQQVEIQHQISEEKDKSNTGIQTYHTNRQHTYEAERELLAMVREGNLNYQPAFEKIRGLSHGVRVRTGKPLEQAAISGIVFTSLCVRAAIEGGLSQENAYTIGDSYIQRMTGCHNLPELSAAISEMYDSFVQRVHRLRTNSEKSKAVLVCCDYISIHLEDQITLKTLAGLAGYDEYYLSRKFKNETGLSISSYIKKARIERAQQYLLTSNDPIQDIARRFQFCSSSYFAKTFQQYTGMTPQEFRAQKHPEKSNS